VTTAYGFHIIQVMEKEPAHLQTLDEVKAQIANGLKAQTVADQMTALADKARAELVKAPNDAAQIAKKYNLTYVEVPKFKAGDPVGDMQADRGLSATLTGLQKGAVSEVTQSENKLVIATATAVQPPHAADFSEAEAQIRSIYPQQRAAQMITEQSAKAAELVKANGGDLKAAAKALKLDLKTTDFFSRNGAVEGVGAGAAFAEAFDKPVGSVVGPMRAGGDTVIAKVIDKQPADMSKLAADRDGIVTQLKSKKAQERQALMRDSILAGLMQQGKVKIHKAAVDRMVARYRARS